MRQTPGRGNAHATSWYTSPDALLIAAALVATAGTASAMFTTITSVDAYDSLSDPAARMWIVGSFCWSVATTAVAVFLLRSRGDRDVARLSLALVVSVPAMLALCERVTLTAQRLTLEHAAALGMPRPFTPTAPAVLRFNYVALLEASDRIDNTIDEIFLTRPAFLLSLVPIALCWVLLVRLPSLSSSPVHRATAHLGSAACALAIIDIGLFSAQRGPVAAIAATVTGVALLVLAWRMALVSRSATVPLARSLKFAQRVGMPLIVAVGGVLALTSAIGWFAGSGRGSIDLHPAAVTYMISVLPVTALVVTIHDYVVVGGRWAMRDLIDSQGAPTLLREALRRRLAAPDLELYFPTVGDDGLIDVVGQPVPLDAEARERLEPVGPPDRPTALVDVGRAGSVPSQRAVLFGVASLAIERANVQARLLSEVELRDARLRDAMAVERARRQVEQDLHDCAQAPLIAVMAALRAATAETSEPVVRRLLGDAEVRVAAAQNAIRELARGQFPHSLRVGGLEPAIEVLTEGLPIAVSATIEVDRLPEQAEIAAYRFVAECLTNVAKHAGVTTASVDARLEGEVLRVSVADTGSGTAEMRPFSGLGAVADRIRLLGGRVRLDTRLGRGTTVVMDLPLDVLDLATTSVDIPEPERAAVSVAQVIDLTVFRRAHGTA